MARELGPTEAQGFLFSRALPGEEATALIAEDQTTTLVSADFTVAVDVQGNLVLERQVVEGAVG